MKQSEIRKINMKNFVLLILASACVSVVLIDCDRQGSARRINPSNNNQRGGFQSPCGTANQVSQKIGKCLVEVFDLIEGRFGEPKSDDDLIVNCNRFNNTERCVRIVAKDCLSGIHKTSTSAVASATKRFRSQECRTAEKRSRYVDPLKCAIRKGKDMAALYRNMTGVAQGIRDLPIAPEEKIVKMCCLLNLVDKEIENRFNMECPKSTPLVLSIVHAMTDDARSTLCANPKCHKSLDGVMRTQYKPPQNFIEPIMQILFQISVD